MELRIEKICIDPSKAGQNVCEENRYALKIKSSNESFSPQALCLMGESDFHMS